LAAIPSDLSLIGAVLAISLAIILLSGVALYVAFRLRETLREERGRGARAAKVAFLIGLLFLSGGVFYFFASGLGAIGNTGGQTILATHTGTVTSGGSAAGTSSTSSPPTATATTSSLVTSTGATTSVSQTSTSTTSSASSTSSTTSTTMTSTSTSGDQNVSMGAPQCPIQVTPGGTFDCQVTIYNQGGTTFSGTTLVASGDFYQFVFVGCSESLNGGASTAVSVSSHAADVGSLAPGTTILDLTVQAPSQPGQYSNSILTLDAPGFQQPVTASFSVRVTH
jgi:hypothetical protein